MNSTSTPTRKKKKKRKNEMNERMRRRKVYVEIKSKNVGFSTSRNGGTERDSISVALQNDGKLYCWDPEEDVNGKIKPFLNFVVGHDTRTELLDGSDARFRYGLGMGQKEQEFCLWFPKSHVRDEWFSFVRRCAVMSRRHWSGLNYELLVSRDDRAREFATSEVFKVRDVPEFSRRAEFSKLLLRCSILYRFDRGFEGDGEEYVASISRPRDRTRATRTV